jgi:hypothetical protein
VIRVALVLACLASPAAADLTPETAAAVDACRAFGPDLEARVATLADTGWHQPEGTEVADVALALAPFAVVQRAYVRPGQSLPERAEALTRGADAVESRIGTDSDIQAHLLAPSGAALEIALNGQGGAFCSLAADVTAADLAAHLGLPYDITDHDFIVSARIATSADSPDTAYHDQFKPDAFGEATVLPMILLSPTRGSE